MSVPFALFAFLLFLPGSEQITDVTAFSDFSGLPTCVQSIMTATPPELGLLGEVCSPWRCICSNQPDATLSVSELVRLGCDPSATTYDIPKGVAFVTSFCAQIDNPLPATITTAGGMPSCSSHLLRQATSHTTTITTTNDQGQVTSFTTVVPISPESGGLTTANIIEIVFGILGFFVALPLAIVAVKKLCC